MNLNMNPVPQPLTVFATPTLFEGKVVIDIKIPPIVVSSDCKIITQFSLEDFFRFTALKSLQACETKKESQVLDETTKPTTMNPPSNIDEKKPVSRSRSKSPKKDVKSHSRSRSPKKGKKYRSKSRSRS